MKTREEKEGDDYHRHQERHGHEECLLSRTLGCVIAMVDVQDTYKYQM